MKRTWSVLAVGVVMAASTVSAQESAPAAPPARQHATVKVEQVPHALKQRVPLEARVVTGAPYSAEVITESIQVLADGNRIVHRTTGRVFRDGQGRTRRETDREGGQPQSVFISDPVSGVSYALDPEAKVAVKSQTAVWTARDGAAGAPLTFVAEGISLTFEPRADPAEFQLQKIIQQKIELAEAGQHVSVGNPLTTPAAAGRTIEKVEKLAAREIEGVSAEGTRTTRTIPVGAIGNERPIEMVTEEWRSADLKVLVSTTTSDPRTGESTYKLVNIVRGEPNAANFEVPAGFTVRDGLRHSIQLKHESQ